MSTNQLIFWMKFVIAAEKKYSKKIFLQIILEI